MATPPFMSCCQWGSFSSCTRLPSFREILVRHSMESLEVVAKVKVESWWSKVIAVTGPEWKETTETKEAEPFLFTLHTLGNGE